MEQITDIKEIQEILFGNLVHFRNICDKYGLRYFLSNGTLLGAVKYSDFIPWDDDADVLMPREDYEKFVRLSGVESDRYTLISFGRAPGWRYAYAKLCDKTTVMREAHADFGTEVGVSLDIFPIDYRTNSRFGSNLHAYRCAWLKRLLCASIQSEFYSPRSGIKRMILKMIYSYSRFVGADKLREKLIRIAEKSHRGGAKRYCGPVVWTCYNKGESIRSEVFDSDVTVDFHGEKFNAPAGYDEYLRGLYGDYEPDPPVERRKSNHMVIIYRK